MAKKIVKKDEELVVEEGNEEVFLVSKDTEEALKITVNEEEEETDLDTEEEEEEVIVITPVEVVNVIKKVRILPAKNHKCYIGGEWYYLVKGKQQNVPENVKNTLLKTVGILSPM